MNWLDQLGGLMTPESGANTGIQDEQPGAPSTEKTSGRGPVSTDSPHVTANGSQLEDRTALRTELLAINERWEKGQAVERQGWRSLQHEEKAHQAFSEMAARSNEIRDQIGPEPWWRGPSGEVADVPDVAQIGADEPESDEVNPLHQHLAKIGGYARAAERFGVADAEWLHEMVCTWWSVKDPDERKRIGDEYKEVFNRAKADEAARKEQT